MKQRAIDLNTRLKWLKDLGCSPSICSRGKEWRAHINSAGNYWADSSTPKKALDEAIRLWENKGRPMDGTSAYQPIIDH